MERAARRQVDQRRRLALDAVQPLVLSDRRSRRGSDASSPRVYGMAAARRRCRRPSRAPPGGRRTSRCTRSATPATTPRSWVISMIDDVRALLDALEHLEHLGLDRHVERGRRLVGDQQRRARWRSPSRSSPAGACRPRTRAGTGRRARLGLRDADDVEQLDRTRRAASSLSSVVSCTAIASAIWSPTVNTGFSAASASWKIIAISLAADRSAAPSRERPSRSCAAEAHLAGDRARSSGSSPRIASDVTLLPEPDSPTMPSVSSACTSKRDVVDRVHDAVVGLERRPRGPTTRTRSGSSAAVGRRSHVSASRSAGRRRRAGRRRGSSRPAR